MVVFELRQTLADDLHGVPVHDLEIAAWFVEQIVERLGDTRKGVKKVVKTAHRTACVVGKNKETAHRVNHPLWFKDSPTLQQGIAGCQTNETAKIRGAVMRPQAIPSFETLGLKAAA